MARHTIGWLARATGCKVPTIRYYERIGLLPEPERSPGNTRLYGRSHLERLSFIQHCRDLGFSQSAIRDLLELGDRPEISCVGVTEIARAHLEDVERKIARLTVLRSELLNMIGACAGGRIEECRIVKAIADYSSSPV
jgi:DNA-binding transcriptional MerR regulator